MSDDPQQEEKPLFEGLCAGGPSNGARISARTKRVPIYTPGKPRTQSCAYVFDATIRMWIWQD